MWPVLNLKPLNIFIYHRHFKMEGMHTVRDLLQRGNWMTRNNIKDAYFTISIHLQHQKFLRKGKCFVYMPNSMSPSKGSVRPSIGGADHPIVWYTESWFPVLMDLLVDYPSTHPAQDGRG